jgi:hypothetical protein
MNRTRSAIIVFTLLALSIAVQSQTTGKATCKKFVFSTSLLEYFPNKLNSANINIASEFCLKERNSISANIGFIKSYGPTSGWIQIPSKSNLGYKVQVEGRHYLDKHKIFEPSILLFWPHIFQFKSQELPNSGYYYALHSEYQSTRTKREIDYTVERYSVGLSLNFGYQCIKKCGLVIDYAIGLGGQYISSNSNNSNNTNNDNDIPWNKIFDSGSGFYPKVIYQVRIGWTR